MIARALLVIPALLATAGLPAPSSSLGLDEGQWLPTQVREMDWDALKARGMELTKDEFWHPEEGGVLSAAININGCTASFVSPDGLIVTNHHCGFGAVEQLSSVENNFLENGFVAMDRTAEPSAPGVTVYVLDRILDVTAQVMELRGEVDDDSQRFLKTQQAIRQIEQEAAANYPDSECTVEEYFEGREYALQIKTRIPDVRLVYAPPRAIGEFGGDVDNWEWPRHTGDFTFFRAYVGPDGKPAPYSDANVPYQPKHHLKVSTAGVQEGDIAVIMGYPGNTQRYKTSEIVRQRLGFTYPKRDVLLTEAIGILQAAGAGDEELALRLTTQIKRWANVQKNAKGMVWGLGRNDVVGRKLGEEAEFTRWVGEDPERKERFGSVLEDQMALDAEEIRTQELDFAMSFTFAYMVRQVPLFLQAFRVANAIEGGDGLANAQFGGAMARPSLDEQWDTVQRPILELMCDDWRRLPEGQRFAGVDVLGSADENGAWEPISDVMDRLLEQSVLDDREGRIDLFSKSREEIHAAEDPLVELAFGAMAAYFEYQERDQRREGRRLEVGRRWIEAQQEWRGKEFYPDANSTLRVSICTVKGYEPEDGVLKTPHTTVAGILAKETGEEPFASPPALLAAAENRAESAFFDQQIGDVPVCFLTDGDTTGGNSGSPVVNGRGELVGLNFDRVFENVSGDFGWNADRSRNISVDIRYVLWVIESVQPAPKLLAELRGK